MAMRMEEEFRRTLRKQKELFKDYDKWFGLFSQELNKSISASIVDVTPVEFARLFEKIRKGFVRFAQQFKSMASDFDKLGKQASGKSSLEAAELCLDGSHLAREASSTIKKLKVDIQKYGNFDPQEEMNKWARFDLDVVRLVAAVIKAMISVRRIKHPSYQRQGSISKFKGATYR